MSESTNFPSNAEQDRILDASRNTVKKSAFFMKRSLDDGDLREGLRHARDMLGELRTSQLNPQKYYDLYMLVFDELAYLRLYVAEEQKKGHKFSDLYQLVQHAGNVLPRLYLMCTVGCEYIKLRATSPRTTLKDLGDLCKGVQHPTRGLFLRSYLCQLSRGLLPENDVEDEEGSIHDAVEFLLSNFIEMNKLWVRMQFQGSKFDQEKREKERKMLQDLVGKNLTFLSQLDGLDFNLYSSLVLTRVIDQIVSCEDVIAQQYLMQCVIQCFPDEFHLETLDELLETLPQLKSGVKLNIVMAGLMDRLAAFAEHKSESVKNANAYERLEKTCSNIVSTHVDMHPADIIDMYIAMLNFTSSIYPQRSDYINGLLASCYNAFGETGVITESRGEASLLELLSLPLAKYDAIALLDLDAYPRLMDLLKSKKRKEMTVRIIRAILDGGFQITNVDYTNKLFLFASPLIKNSEYSMADDEEDEEGEWLDRADGNGNPDLEILEEEQILLAKLVHHLNSENSLTEQFEMLKIALINFEEGGMKRMRYTLMSIIFSGLNLIRNICENKDKNNNEENVSIEEIFDWIMNVCGLLVEVPMPMLGLQCLLQCAIFASEQANIEEIAYDCFEMACTLYEESLSDPNEKNSALQSIVSAIHACHIFSEENRSALSQTVLGYCAQLLKKDEQCKAICLYSHIYWQKEEENIKVIRDASSVMKNLKKCINIVTTAKRRADILARMGKSMEIVGLYIELLNTYLYYFDRGNEEIDVSAIQSLLDLIEMEFADKKISDANRNFYNNTLEHIMFQHSNKETNERYDGLNIPNLKTEA